MHRLLLTVAVGVGIALLGTSTAHAQAAVEKQVGFGTANIILPTITAGVELVSPSGLSVGGGGLLAAWPGWALYGVVARAGLHGWDSSLTRPFVAVELAALGETDCCGGTALGVSGGVTRWDPDRRSGVRIEGRLLLPTDSEGILLLVQVGLALR